MRGLHNLLSNFLIQLSTLISHVLFSPDILFHIFVMLSVGYKIIGGIFIKKILIWPPITQYHYSSLSRLDVHTKMFTSKVMHNQIVLCKPFMNNLCNQENLFVSVQDSLGIIHARGTQTPRVISPADDFTKKRWENMLSQGSGQLRCCQED